MVSKLTPQPRLIKNPIILVVDDAEKEYSSGEELKALTFEKNYSIDSITARDGRVVVMLKENDKQFFNNWIEEEVSFI